MIKSSDLKFMVRWEHFGILGPILFPDYTLSIAYLDDGSYGVHLGYAWRPDGI